jgi:hypothetical protein
MLWVFLTVAAVGLFWYGYRHPYRRRWLLPRPSVAQPAASAVDRQHRHIQEGGLVGESAVAATASHFDELLRAGRAAEVERELKPGVGFAVQVRALTAVGTPEAGRVLERQLGRSLVRDPVEQTWYWADVAAGLRHLHHVLRGTERVIILGQGMDSSILERLERPFPPRDMSAYAVPAVALGEICQPRLRSLALVDYRHHGPRDASSSSNGNVPSFCRPQPTSDHGEFGHCEHGVHELTGVVPSGNSSFSETCRRRSFRSSINGWSLASLMSLTIRS